MPKYRMKPIVVDAVQFRTSENPEQWPEGVWWGGDKPRGTGCYLANTANGPRLIIDGDYLVTHTNGMRFVIPAKEFEERWDLIVPPVLIVLDEAESVPAELYDRAKEFSKPTG